MNKIVTGIKDLLGAGVEKTVETVGNAFDKNFTSKEERMEQKNIALQAINDLAFKIAKLQADILTAEANGNWLQRSWRPIVMLTFAFIVVYAFFLAPIIPAFTAITLPIEFWALLKIGLGGYVVGRSAEKITTKVAPNLNFNKKK